jgi:hypothetical protein
MAHRRALMDDDDAVSLDVCEVLVTSGRRNAWTAP